MTDFELLCLCEGNKDFTDTFNEEKKMTKLTVVPAYGRDYNSKAAVEKDFMANKDFVVCDLFSGSDGQYVNREDLQGSEFTDLNVRYKNRTRIHVIKLV